MWQMKDDDPEKRIRELESGFGGPPPATGGPFYDTGFTSPPRRTGLRWPLLVAFALAILVPIAMAVVWGINAVRNTAANVNRGGPAGNVPITLEHGATFSLGGNGSNDTIGCNDGSLTLNANNSTVNVTGHCASLKVRGFDNHVNIDKADIIEVSGYGNAITETACNDGKLSLVSYGNTFSTRGHCASLTLSAYGNRVQADSIDGIVITNYDSRVTVTGHCGSVTASLYGNQVQCDSVDTIELTGFNNTVTYHSGSPKITKSGRNNNVNQR